MDKEALKAKLDLKEAIYLMEHKRNNDDYKKRLAKRMVKNRGRLLKKLERSESESDN